MSDETTGWQPDEVEVSYIEQSDSWTVIHKATGRYHGVRRRELDMAALTTGVRHPLQEIIAIAQRKIEAEGVGGMLRLGPR